MSNIVEKLKEAVHQPTAVQFDYDLERRTVEIEDVTTNAEGQYYVVGFDVNRQGYRRFHANQIRNLTVN